METTINLGTIEDNKDHFLIKFYLIIACFSPLNNILVTNRVEDAWPCCAHAFLLKHPCLNSFREDGFEQVLVFSFFLSVKYLFANYISMINDGYILTNQIVFKLHSEFFFSVGV